MEKIKRDVFWSATSGRLMRMTLDNLNNFRPDNLEDLLDKEEAVRRIQRILHRNVTVR